MMRKPRRWSPNGTEPPALSGSRDAPTTAIVFALSSTSRELTVTSTASAPAGRLFLAGALGRRGLGHRDGLESKPKHLFHATREVERHRLAHALRHVVEVLFVALREDDLFQAHAVSRQHLLLDPADRQDQTLKRDLARHADRAAHGPPGEQAHDRR